MDAGQKLDSRNGPSIENYKRYRPWLEGVMDWKITPWESELKDGTERWHDYSNILKRLDGRYERDDEGNWRPINGREGY